MDGKFIKELHLEVLCTPNPSTDLFKVQAESYKEQIHSE